MCGILAVLSRVPVAGDLYHGLCQLQHRGQHGAGIVTHDGGRFHSVKGLGLVHQVFGADNVQGLSGSWGIGHVRYPTSGLVTEAEVQPFISPSSVGEVTLAYNGNLVNAIQVRRALEREGCHFTSSSDAEVLMQQLVQNMVNEGTLQDRIFAAAREVCLKVEGAFSVVGMVANGGMFAFRDPNGLRPLVMGQSAGGSSFAFASETYALSFIGFENLKDLAPGECVFIDREGTVHRRQLLRRPARHCSFEYVYFTKGNAILEGRDVYKVRAALGKSLAQRCRDLGVHADVVTAVPNTSHPAALAMAWELGIPIEEGLIRRDHSGRTFILPSQQARETAVNSKLAPVASVFRNRRVIIVDDSIVRGTVSKRIIAAARKCGATEVTFCATFPPITHPCFYGIDMHSPEELVGRGRGFEEIAEAIGADRVIYNDVEALKAAIGMDGLCYACCNGDYPTPLCGVEDLQDQRMADQRQVAGVCS